MSCFYTQLGKTVIVAGRFVLGSTSAVSSGPIMSLPVSNNTTTYSTTYQNIIGNATYSQTNLVPGVLSINSSSGANNAQFLFITGSVIYGGISSTTPATWGTGNVITWHAIYEAA